MEALQPAPEESIEGVLERIEDAGTTFERRLTAPLQGRGLLGYATVFGRAGALNFQEILDLGEFSTQDMARIAHATQRYRGRSLRYGPRTAERTKMVEKHCKQLKRSCYDLIPRLCMINEHLYRLVGRYEGIHLVRDQDLRSTVMQGLKRRAPMLQAQLQGIYVRRGLNAIAQLRNDMVHSDSGQPFTIVPRESGLSLLLNRQLAESLGARELDACAYMFGLYCETLDDTASAVGLLLERPRGPRKI